MWCLPASLRIRRKTFPQQSRRLGVWDCESLWLYCESLLVSLAENHIGTRFTRWWRGMTKEGDCYGRWSHPNVVRVDHVTSGRICPLRKVISGEEGWPWEGRRVGRSWFAAASCELLIIPQSASPLADALSSPVLENHVCLSNFTDIA